MTSIVNFDIVLTLARDGYSARADTNTFGSTNAAPMKLRDGALLSSPTSLQTIFGQPGPAAGPASNQPPTATGAARPTPFEQALIRMQVGYPSSSDVEILGDGLYTALPDPVRDLLNLVWGDIRTSRSRILRLRLHFDSPELGLLPWEYMKIGSTYFCEHPQRSLVRYPEVADPLRPLKQTRPLKVLIWTANPVNAATLDSQQEIDHITHELAQGLSDAAQIEVVRSGGPRDLFEKLAEGFHVLHYIGHGIFRGEGMLAFERTPGDAATLVPADQLKPGLLDSAALQLVFLNACATATSSVTNAYASLGFNLARYTPAVVAMQYPIPDDSAIIFAQEFYRAYSRRQPLDLCLTAGRQALIAEYGTQKKDWGIPVLYTRSIS